jgi:predicted ArsR family transcriptional regulator
MAVDRLGAVGDPGLRAALLFVRAEARPVTADDLAEARGIHRNVARSRLERLVSAGLVEADFERRSERSGPGAGRPAKTYRAAPDLSGIEFPARHYETLLGLLADELPRDRLRAVGAAFGHELAHAAGVRPAKPTTEGLERVCSALRSLGYQATLEHADGNEAVIATPNCPLRPLVVAQPGAGMIDEGMWAGLTEAALTGHRADAIACEACGCLDAHASCRIHLYLQSRR